MTVSTTGLRITHNGNGATTEFAFPYRFLANGDLQVILIEADGTEVAQVLNTNYTVAGAGVESGGTVTMIVAPAAGQKVFIRRELELTQEVDYITGDRFPAETHETALDRLTMIAQQTNDGVERSLKITPIDTEAGISSELPPVSPGSALIWGNAGLENLPLNFGVLDQQDVITASNIALLRTLSGTDGDYAFVAGYYTPGDGGGGPLRVWKTGAPGTYVDNGGSIIVPTGGDGSGAWVWGDLAEVDALWFGVDATGQTVTNDTLTEFFSYVRSTRPKVGFLAGRFRVTAPFTMDVISSYIVSDAIFITNNVSEVGMYINVGYGNIDGKLQVDCADSLAHSLENYATRRQDIGVVITNSRIGRVGKIYVNGTKKTGVKITSTGGNTNMFSLDLVQTRYTGASNIFNSTPTDITNTGAVTSGTQRGYITTPDIPEKLEQYDHLEINGDVYVVMGVVDNVIECFPQIKDTTLSEISYFVGAGLEIFGSDANVCRIGVVDNSACGASVKALSLYGPTIQNLHCSVAGVGLVAGRATASVSYGGYVGYLYTEGPIIGVIEAGAHNNAWVIATYEGADFKHVVLGASVVSTRVLSQRLTPSSHPTFNQLTLGNDSEQSRSGYRWYLNNPLSFSSGYLVLCENVGKPTESYFLRIHGTRTVGGTGIGRNYLQADIAVTHANNGLVAVTLDQSGYGGDLSLVTLDYDGKSWIALKLSGSLQLLTGRYDVLKTQFSPELFELDAGQITNEADRVSDGFSKIMDTLIVDGPTRTTRPKLDNVQQLGTADFRWSEVFAGNATINTSDGRDKQQIRDLTTQEKLVANDLKQAIKAFKFNDSIERKGDGARIHIGIVAQEVAAIFEARDLNPADYSLFCHDVWEPVYEDIIEIDEVLDDEGNVVDTVETVTGEKRLVSEGGDRYGIRYEQLLAFVVSAL